eukprot:TRINITY_DN9612_c0_g1_i1.p1 TRINITY_DN9612_c0_g1~~TRINITY_DN9612_c0_g1_i1.p1  ORF type:complete len:545 (+),score=118.30 TRINITY_DN9612_c0_g1_i1:288-1922(+)
MQAQVIDLLEAEKARSTDLVEKAKEASTKSLQEIEALCSKINAQEQALEELQEQYKKLQESYSNALLESQSLRSQISDLTKENLEFKNTVQNQVSLLQEKALLEETSHSVQERLDLTCSEKSKIEAQLDQLKKELLSKEASNEATFLSLVKVLKSTFPDTVPALKETYPLDWDVPKDLYSFTTDELYASSPGVAHLIDMFRALHFTWQKMNKEKARLMNVLAEMASREKKLQNQYANAVQAKEAAVQKVETLHQNMTSVSKSLQDLTQFKEQAAEAAQSSQQLQHQLEAELENNRAHIERIQTENKELRMAWNSAHEQLSKLHEEHREARDQLTRAVQEKDRIGKDLDLARKALHSVQSMQSEINETLGTSLKTKNSFARKISSMQSRIESLEEENAILRSKVEEETHKRRVAQQTSHKQTAQIANLPLDVGGYITPTAHPPILARYQSEVITTHRAMDYSATPEPHTRSLQMANESLALQGRHVSYSIDNTPTTMRTNLYPVAQSKPSERTGRSLADVEPVQDSSTQIRDLKERLRTLIEKRQ